MKENLVTEPVDYWGEEARQASKELYPLTPEEEDALWADPVYGSAVEEDDDWDSDQSAGTPSRGQDSFRLKYMDEEKTVSREEVVTLAQKGMDYDRVRRRLDEAGSALKEYKELKGKLGLRGEQLRWMDELAREQGKSLDEILEEAHVQLLMGKSGKSEEVCRTSARQQKEEWQRGNSARQRRNDEITDFFRVYPEQAKDPGKIPKSVWEQVKGGETLLNAYRNYEVESLRKELAQQKAERQRLQDQVRTTGSQSSRGSKWTDPFDAIWYDGE